MPDAADAATGDGTSEETERRLRLRYAGTCRRCGAVLPAGQVALYQRSTRSVRCVDQPGLPGDVTPVPRATPPSAEGQPPEGRAGASARREYERRKARDEHRLRERWGRLGGLAVALSDERQSTRAWDVGAIGEERLGQRLDAIGSETCQVLHDRRVPGTRANIDHLVLTPAAVWVVDAKRYRGRPSLKVEGGVLRPRTERLLVGRRDCTSLVDGVRKQMAVVRGVVGDRPIRAALCFVEADWPLVGGGFAIDDVEVLWPRRLARLLSTERTGEVDVPAVAAALARALPPA